MLRLARTRLDREYPQCILQPNDLAQECYLGLVDQARLQWQNGHQPPNTYSALRQTQLSKLVEEASRGVPFVIAKAGKPVVKVTALSAPVGAQVRRVGFMTGQISVPDDFDQMGKEEIERMFGGSA